MAPIYPSLLLEEAIQKKAKWTFLKSELDLEVYLLSTERTWDCKVLPCEGLELNGVKLGPSAFEA